VPPPVPPPWQLTGQDQPVDGPAGDPRRRVAAVGSGDQDARADPLRDRADVLRATRTPFVRATVVRAVRPTSAKAGDLALVLPDGSIEGFVGGSCAESSVRLHGLRVLQAREPVVLRIMPGAVPAGAQADDPAGAAAAAAHLPAGAAEGQVTVSNPCASGGMLEIFLEGVFPPPLVQVSGDAPIARALRGIGGALGYEIRPAGPGGPVAADAAAVIVASHGRDEEPLLTAALRAGVPYVGLVASRRRGSQVVAALDVPAAEAQRLHTPAGLDIGARTPEEVALSIFAQIVAERSHAPAPAPAAGAAEDMPPDRTAAASRETVDPVCGMTVGETEATPHLAHDRRMWYFCGPGCRQAFADDPPRYLR
jgi:xanthine dehydrogenase accessory factor